MCVSASTSSVVAGSRMPQTTISAVENQVSDGATWARRAERAGWARSVAFARGWSACDQANNRRIGAARDVREASPGPAERSPDRVNGGASSAGFVHRFAAAPLLLLAVLGRLLGLGRGLLFVARRRGRRFIVRRARRRFFLGALLLGGCRTRSSSRPAAFVPRSRPIPHSHSASTRSRARCRTRRRARARSRRGRAARLW